jgi:hypothetical protein
MEEGRRSKALAHLGYRFLARIFVDGFGVLVLESFWSWGVDFGTVIVFGGTIWGPWGIIDGIPMSITAYGLEQS